ncbi:CocE/NonD family hydrolase [Altericroceibacterium endophyticum]|uniref:CocE/NonD family hydrolase n=1 Tax=Altericroceibacterium endophyticum TaxID=1808508 RepID=A0A6I4T725_9SPHN|nr:CocE/NonD family hydrolase [Altericroceibacterium endophyticum]MXO66746.1 CocE/NonD family hydrolase [Altericroceibacterium endophyticum]
MLTRPFRTMSAALACTVMTVPALSVPALAQDYPDYQRESLYVPVRDGTRLAMNVYRPADGDGVETDKLPTIFVFTPYRARYTDEEGKVHETALEDGLALRSLLRAGYIVAVADIRGKGASFGSRRGFQDRTEAQDGHDLVEWLARQPWSSGKVGMVGCSYLGGTTMHTASTAPRALKAIFTGATDWDKYEFVRRGGITAQFNTRPDEPLSDDLASVPVDADSNGALLREAVAMHAENTSMAGLWYGMPYRDSISALTGNAFWQEAAIWQYAQTIKQAGIATYLWSNWKDEPTSHILVAAENLDSKLLVGPGSHCQTPKDYDFTGQITRYFDHYLKGEDNGFTDEPRVTYWHDDGADGGTYIETDTVPGSASDTLTYYLGQQGGNLLAPRPVNSGSAGFAVDYDIADDAYFPFWPPSLDDHGVTFDSAPASAALDLLGYPVANIAISVDRPDADVFVYLEDVGSDGAVEVVSFGRLKVSHRKTSAAPWDTMGLPWHSGREADVMPLGAGETAMLSIAMMPLAHRVLPGHRLRFLVTGADPRQRNLADLVQNPPPKIAVHYGWETGSRLDLPLARPSDMKGRDE